MKHLKKFNNLINEDLAKSNPNLGETYLGYFSKCLELDSIIQEQGEIINRYFELTRQIHDWDSIYSPNISISEVNNDNMGHMYMGKIRIPKYFAENLGRLGAKSGVLTFAVCKYEDYPGPGYEKQRRKLAIQRGFERLSRVYPNRFPPNFPGPISVNGVTIDNPVETLPELLKNIEDFKLKY